MANMRQKKESTSPASVSVLVDMGASEMEIENDASGSVDWIWMGVE